MCLKYGRGLLVAVVVAVSGAMQVVVAAESLPKTELKVVGSLANLAAYKDFEKPFWTQQIPEKSGGAIVPTIKGFDEMGLKGQEVMRLLNQGVMDIGATVMFYLAPDDPAMEAVDIAGMLPDVGSARAATDASKKFYGRVFREKYGLELLGIGTYPAQVLYCNVPIKGLSDIKGKKVRVGGRSQGELVEALGGKPVSLPFREVVIAMVNNTIDCAITGTLSGNAARWYIVSTHLYTLPLSWGQIAYAANSKKWSQLDPRVRSLIQNEVHRLEKEIWDAAAMQTDLGILCNTGDPKCTLKTKGKMILVSPTDADRAQLRRIVTETMLPKWAARCDAECVREFNNTIGKVVNLSAKK